jgi:uracil-DNA glycosylase
MSNSISAASFVLDVRDDGSVKRVENAQPVFTTETKLAIVSDFPMADDLVEKHPLGGAVGRLLFGLMARNGVARAQCFVGFLSNVVGQKTSAIDASLIPGLKTFGPNCVLTLGPAAARFFFDNPKLKLAEWRGSCLVSRLPDLPGVKIVPAWHPTDVFKQWDEFPLFQFDVKRACEQAAYPEHTPPLRMFDLEPTYERAITNLLSIREGELLSLDIEGGVKGMSCISFTQHHMSGFIIPWNTFSLDQQTALAPYLASVLGNPRIPKVLQNSLYDNFVLSYAYKMPIRGVVHDTMLSGWEIYPELPKKLGVQASIWTDEPYYKFNRASDDPKVLWHYCCTDSAVTLEIAEKHDKALSGASAADATAVSA